jgi:hypothetical protein
MIIPFAMWCSTCSTDYDSFLEAVGLSATKHDYLGWDGKPTSYVKLGYFLSRKEGGKKPYYEWCLGVAEYKLVVDTLRMLYEEYRHTLKTDLLSDIGQQRLESMFLAITIESKRPQLDQAIANVKAGLTRKPNPLEVFCAHPAHTFVGKALWCLVPSPP